jgi:hypothetical protein
MALAEVLLEAWRQTLVDGLSEIELSGTRYRVGRTRGQGLRVVSFAYETMVIDGIEQNPEKTSRWAELAREGKRIMQFSYRQRFFANVCDGSLTRYPVWGSLGLPP